MHHIFKFCSNKLWKYLITFIRRYIFDALAKNWSLFHIILTQISFIQMKLKNKNYQMNSKNYQNLTWHELRCLLAIQKFWESNHTSTATSTPNHTGSFSTIMKLLQRCSGCEQRTWQHMWNLLNFLPQPPHTISWHLVKFHNFWTSFAFYRI